MPATVPPFGWRVPEGADPPDGPQAFLELATDIAATAVARERRIWTYSGPLTFNASGNATIAHGLGVVPSAVTFAAVLASSIVHLSAASAPSSTSLTVRGLTPSGLFTASLSQAWITLIGGQNVAYYSAPPPPAPLPESTWLKADIVAWLLDNGVALDADALAHLTKTELLALVADLLDTETE